MVKQRRLDEFSTNYRVPNGIREKPTVSIELKENEVTKDNVHETHIGEARKKAVKKTDPMQLPPSYFVSAFYDGNRSSVCLKLYEPESGNIYFWHDRSEHKPYLLTNLSPFELDKLKRVKTHPGFSHIENVKKFDSLKHENVTLTKVVAKDPLSIGGRPKGCLREVIPEEHAKTTEQGENKAKVWEAAIKYYQCYIYDRNLVPGMLYSVENGNLVLAKVDSAEKQVKEHQALFGTKTLEERKYIERWLRLLEYPAPQFRRVALDIEVFSPVASRVPDPQEAPYQVTCVSLVTTEGHNRVLLLRRKGMKDDLEKLPLDTKMEFFEQEEDLIRTVFDVLRDYPFVITFNGDDFDLRYLAHRALKIGIRRSDIPIEVRRRVCLLKTGVHIDLYKFFYNRSIQIYAFSNKYRDVTLDAIGKELIALPKIKLDKTFNDLSLHELARYCLRDAEITFKLTSFNDNLTLKLIMVLARISKMPMEDVSRQGVSRWIRNFLHFEHRRVNMLIPNTSDILAVKGKTATKAIIKGKKYKGAMVVEPVPGVHFNVAVMDFPSLYPSIIKVWNLGYQTILCPHEECRENTVPDTPHWICRRNKALESLLIGSLRDLRVTLYKAKSKDKTLSADVKSWYNVIQSALKVILNASYGVFGAESFDLYCPPVAEATAAIGRQSIALIVSKAKDLNVEVIYGDTDSVFLKNPTEAQIRTLAEWSEKELKMGLEVDKKYRYAVLSSRKKNYLGVFEDGKVDVKGMTGKKKHIPKFIKDAFNEMKVRLEEVQSSADFESAKKDIRKIVLDRHTRLRRREWTLLSDLAFHVVLGASPDRYVKTTPQHVVAARILQDKKIDMKVGDRVSFVKIKPREMPIAKKRVRVNVMPIQLAVDGDIDVDKYVDYLHSTFDQVLDSLGLDFEEIIGLTKLERFM